MEQNGLFSIPFAWRLLFCVDPLLKFMDISSRYPCICSVGVQRELHAYRHSLLKLQNNVGAFDEIYPAHGTCPVKPSIIMELYEAAGKILDGQLTGHREEMFGNPITGYDAGPAFFLCDPDY